MIILCGVCCDKGNYAKPALPVTVKSGELRISTHLCQDCAAKAEDAQEQTIEWEIGTTSSDTTAVGTDDVTNDLGFTAT